MTLILLSLFSASAQTTSPSWQDELAADFASQEPDAGWDVVPVPQATAAKTKADILIESFRDGSAEAHHAGNLTLKRGYLLEAVNTDGTQGLVLAETLVCPWGEACVSIPTMIAYLVVDLEVLADGSQTARVTDMLIPFDTAFSGVEPEEID